MAAEIGDSCTNAPFLDRWTCPECFHDHMRRVTACAGCGATLKCTVERQPVAICVLVAQAPDRASA